MASLNRYLKNSQNYIWNTSLVLGKGATASVYQGMNKHNGDLVAIKFFNMVSHHRPYEVQRREYEVLSKINHINIVKLFAIEEEDETKNNVLVMELCTGGSLFNILDDPVNGFGLEEREFLLVLEHLAAGMKHLTDLNIIHRDLKPGNIMKFISEDGQSIYKLTDFGAARELGEDQKFMSLYGTEEYLHPDLYERAVLRKPAAKQFSAKVDLWSIGVTLYHIATGSLPFRPFGGRKNQLMMHRITTEKQSGIISGIQHSENGEVEWSSNLPKTCLLCPSLQDKVTPLLAGLMECHDSKMWTFDQFFRSVTHILSHKAVYVFNVNKICDYTYYVQPNEKLSHLKARLAIKESANIPIQNQLLIWNKREVSDTDSIIFSTQDNPIILLNSNATSIKPSNSFMTNQIKFPEILNIVASSGDQDAQLAKACASIAYCIQRNTEKCMSHSNLINQVPYQIMSLIESNIKLLNEKRESCSHLMDSLVDQIEYTIETSINLSKCSTAGLNQPSTTPVKLTDVCGLRASYIENLEKNWKELLPKLADMNKRISGLSDRWYSEPKVYQNKINCAKSRSEHLCSKIKDSWLFLHKNRSSKVVVGKESQLHNLEKLRVDSNCKKLLKSSYEDTYQALSGLVERLDDWYNDAHVALVQSSCLFDELSRLMNSRDIVLEQLNETIEKQHQQWQALITKSIKNADNSKLTDNNWDCEVDSISKDLAESNMDNIPTFVPEQAYSECSHDPEDLFEEIRNLQETQRLLRASLSENQSLFSELVSLTFLGKKTG